MPCGFARPTAMSSNSSSPSLHMRSDSLLHYNRILLDQAIDLVDAHDAPGAPAYDGIAGPHLRHVIEHYEQFLGVDRGGMLDYDQRLRDPVLESSTGAARERLTEIQRALAFWYGFAAETPVRLRGACGLGGEHSFEVTSTLGRELAFLAGHAVHHFALLKDYCLQHDIAVATGFGKAPATIAHENSVRSLNYLLKGKNAS